MVLLIGNYAPDQQQSMQRFSTMMLQGLAAAGVQAELVQPEPFLGRFRGAGAFMAKWLAYVDKFLLFPRRLRARIASGATLVHICDHSNAVYASHCAPLPVVVTCHDLLAVRGALGDATDTPASRTGRYLQRWILRGLRKANVVACISSATQRDAQQLLGTSGSDAPRVCTILLGLSYPYRKLAAAEADARLRSISGWDPAKPYVLHVGSNLRRKNRDAVLRIFARTKEQWAGQVVFAGEGLTPELHSLGRELGISSRIVEVVNPDNPLLEALYNCATALVYPSRFEGFGWPIAEAQACGCPVICSDRGPMPEVAGDAGLIHPVEDEAAFAADILRMHDPAARERWSAGSVQNAERFSAARMIAEYVRVYQTLAPQL